MRSSFGLALLGVLVSACTSAHTGVKNSWSPTEPPCESRLQPVESSIVENVSYTAGGQQAPLPCLDFYRDVQERPVQDRTKAVAMAISGGGHRAANYALGVLIALESFKHDGQTTNLLREIDYFSTVSGGGFATGAYLANFYDFLRERPNFPYELAAQNYSLTKATFASRTSLRRDLARGLQHSMYRAAIQPGLGRQEYLEDRLDEVILRRKSRQESHNREESRHGSLTLADIFIPNCSHSDNLVNSKACIDNPSQTVRMPYWFANAAVAGNGAIFPFSPDILTLYKATGFHHNLRDQTLSNPYDMPLAVGMTASASFPVGIPPSTLVTSYQPAETNGQSVYEIQLLDGGVADNLGVLTAISVLRQDKAKEKILIVVDAYIGNYWPYQPRGNRLSTFDVALRTMSVYLDSWRGRHRDVVAQMAAGLAKPGEKWHIVFLSFDELLSSQAFETLAAKARAEGREDLYNLVRSVGTNFSISEAQQDALLEAGMTVVENKTNEICAAFYIPCSGSKQ